MQESRSFLEVSALQFWEKLDSVSGYEWWIQVEKRLLKDHETQ